MVAVRLSRFSAEVLGTERDRLSVTRVSAHAAALHAEEAARVRASRFSAEVLADQDSAEIVDVTRVNAHVGALYADGSAPVALSRLSAEVLADSPIIVGVTRVNAHSAAVYSQGAARIRITRFSAEVLGRASSSIVYPQEFVSGSDVFFHNWEETCQVTTSFRTVPSTSPDTGAESRRGLAARPVRVVAAQFLVNGATHLKRVKMFIRKVTTGYFHFPLYPDQAVLAADYDTSATFLAFTTGTGRWFRGARVAVVRIGSDGCEGEVTYHTIASKNLLGITLASAIGTAAPEGSVVFPLLDVHPLLEPSIEMVTDGVYRVRIEGLEISGPSALPQISDEIDPEAPEHDGLPIWNVSPDWSFPVSSFRSRDGEGYGHRPVACIHPECDALAPGVRLPHHGHARGYVLSASPVRVPPWAPLPLLVHRH
jgi:hypothetical protein